jgi:hypothetical protein
LLAKGGTLGFPLQDPPFHRHPSKREDDAQAERRNARLSEHQGFVVVEKVGLAAWAVEASDPHAHI